MYKYTYTSSYSISSTFISPFFQCRLSCLSFDQTISESSSTSTTDSKVVLQFDVANPDDSDESNYSPGEQMMLALFDCGKQLIEAEKAKRNRRQKKKYYNRNRESGHIQLFKDYFSDQPVYPDYIFRRRF